MRDLVKRFVLRKRRLNLDDVVNDTLKICETTDREIIIVGGYFQYLLYRWVKRRIRKLNSLIPVSYKRSRSEEDLPYNMGPYFIEIGCFKFE